MITERIQQLAGIQMDDPIEEASLLDEATIGGTNGKTLVDIRQIEDNKGYVRLFKADSISAMKYTASAQRIEHFGKQVHNDTIKAAESVYKMAGYDVDPFGGFDKTVMIYSSRKVAYLVIWVGYFYIKDMPSPRDPSFRSIENAIKKAGFSFGKYSDYYGKE